VISLRLAAWYHDVVYDTKARDNEERSACLMLERLEPLDVPAGIVDRAARLIRATAKHIVPKDCPESALLLDADLAILGAPSEVYDLYSDQIRREYAWVSETEYRTGRAAVLTSFLIREHIYMSPRMQDLYEAAAVENLKREVAILGESAP